MFRKVRIILAAIFFIAITLLFLGICGGYAKWLSWAPKMQFLPAVLSLNIIVVAALIILTLIIGRIYCSVICPLGVMQDVISWISGKRKGKKNRFTYSPAISWLRYVVLGLFILAIVFGIHSFVALLAPYSSYGRIASNLFAPAVQLGHYHILSYYVFGVAVVTLVVIFILAWRNGRTYCNTICPVGTVLGFFSRFAMFRPMIDNSKCVGCKLCGRRCKASCINYDNHKIDYSRCISCGDCIGNCNQGAIRYHFMWKGKQQDAAEVKKAVVDADKKSDAPAQQTVGTQNFTRRNFLTATAMLATTAALAKDKCVTKVMGEPDKVSRETPILPPGAMSAENMADHCTGCQLCIANCPGHVLHPSMGLMTFMQPTVSYEKGFCQPDCDKCSNLCPAGAIKPIKAETKFKVHIGHAVWQGFNCLVLNKNVACGVCWQNCPYGAITMLPLDETNPDSLQYPSVDDSICVGCGACEKACPARPAKAIYVEGYSKQVFDK
jgi:ferredoxin